MPVQQSLLEMLVCPACRTAVTPTPDGTGLVCGTCHRLYPVVDDVPFMLIEDPSIESGKRS